MSKKYFALIRFIGGEDDKKYTVGIPTDWIIDFDVDEYLADNYDPTAIFVLEWREGKKQPKIGWPLYDIHVIHVSERLAVLEKRFQVLEGTKSPRTVSKNDDNQSNKDKMPKNLASISCSRPSQHSKISQESLSASEYEESDNDKENFGGLRDVSGEESENEKDLFELPSQKQEEKLKKTHKPSNESPTLKDIMNELRNTHNDILEIKQKINLIPNEAGKLPIKRPTTQPMGESSRTVKRLKFDYESTVKNVDDLEGSDFYEGMIEIGAPGSGLTVTDFQWTTAVSKGTYTAMAVSLMMDLISPRKLLKSNYKGGASKLKNKLPADQQPPRYEALDENIVKAIKYSVQKVYPKTYNEARIGTAINTKLTNLRAAAAVKTTDSDELPHEES